MLPVHFNTIQFSIQDSIGSKHILASQNIVTLHSFPFVKYLYKLPRCKVTYLTSLKFQENKLLNYSILSEYVYRDGNILHPL